MRKRNPFPPDFNVVWCFGFASRQPKRLFSTLAQNTPVGPNIEIGAAGGSMYLFDSRLIRRFFLYLDTEWTMLCYANLTSIFKNAVSSWAPLFEVIVKSCMGDDGTGMNNQFHSEPIADAPRVLWKRYGKAAMGAICGRQAGGWKAGSGRRSGKLGMCEGVGNCRPCTVLN